MPAVTRKGDADVTHCSTPNRQGASTDVFVNGIGVSRQDDNNTSHLYHPYLVLVTLQQLQQEVQPCL